MANHKEPNGIIRNYQDWAMQEGVADSSGGVCQGSALRLRGHPPHPPTYVMKASEKRDVKGFENCKACKTLGGH